MLRGGAWIGYLERGAVAATMLAAFPEGLALVLAVKGVGRYPELRDAGGGDRAGRDAPEEFIIGTLASLLWAAAAPAPPCCSADAPLTSRSPATATRANPTVSPCAS